MSVADVKPEPAADLKDGKVVSIAGPVVDVEFPPGELPEINFALQFSVELEGRTLDITAEVAQHIGESRVRAVAMKPTDGLRRGTRVKNLGHGITVPVGDGVLGHVFNVIGEPLDTRWRAGHKGHRRPLGDPPPLTEVRRPHAEVGDVRDRHQGHRPARALRQGRQDRHVRRRGGG